MKGVVTWASTVEIHVVCKYVKHRWVGHSFTPVVDKIRFREERLGNFSFKMQQFKTENFVNPYSKKDFPVAVKVRDKMYFLLSVDSKDEDVKLFAKTCKATTTPSPKDPIQFLFISNGCPVSHSVKFLPCQNPKEIRLSLKAFQFLKILPQIYLHCKLTACHSQDTTSRCTNGCLRSDERRKKREEADDGYQLTAGPFQYVLQ
ncbi:ZP domain-containing protein-like [Lingula anatina]|uniref:ZP domain-containing protein-like n=1 Tax=Lingula anatina TaxID=7574 RepID=A0A1S3KB47_LINAN|nr:ZP domain-containing protein-like [Lingula anatina]|eukprot:XP_013419863.1 ZP domain-containing protein-like [Lingula anatina]